jgi:hypothetical protein
VHGARSYLHCNPDPTTFSVLFSGDLRARAGAGDIA